jgi:hypothetical protein
MGHIVTGRAFKNYAAQTSRTFDRRYAWRSVPCHVFPKAGSVFAGCWMVEPSPIGALVNFAQFSGSIALRNALSGQDNLWRRTFRGFERQ